MKKLKLNRETLVRLEPPKAAQVVGGINVQTPGRIGCPSWGCPSIACPTQS